MIEVGHHRVGQSELVGREDELIGPTLVLLQQAVSTHSGLCGAGHTGAYDADAVLGEFRGVHNLAGLLRDEHLLGRHLVLREVLDLDGIEAAKSAVQGDIGEIDALDLHTLHELTAEVQTSGGSGNGALVLSIDGLEALDVFGCCWTAIDDIAG